MTETYLDARIAAEDGEVKGVRIIDTEEGDHFWFGTFVHDFPDDGHRYQFGMKHSELLNKRIGP